MARMLIAGNWKMHKAPSEARLYCEKLLELVKGVDDRDIAVLAPFVDLPVLNDLLLGTNVAYGAQNLFWEEKGAYTGEVSAPMLAELGCRFVIVGHSERRQYFGETNESCNKKIAAAINFGLVPIYCIGEVLEQRESGATFDVLRDQLLEGLSGFDAVFIKDLVIAYEPVWAIGTGKTATPEQAEKAHEFIRFTVAREFGSDLANYLRVIYGGSVNPDNAASLLTMPNVDGALVGGASLDAEKFANIVKFDG